MNGTELTIILGMTLVTFGIRGLVLLFSGRIEISGAWERALVFVPPAVLSAIIAPSVLMPRGSLELSFGNFYLISGCAALMAGIIFRRYALWAAIVTGLAVFGLYRFFLL
ncbi:AzlD domain-containing protein [Marispirochaeta aestuarii]|uniref:AzlD domain-containing protein n=1 Tax=Marispirochaeta aestuarii TaxID=1963862 RepID=UPI0029C7C31C|nr:AzlD domain-containing protein [Marispirochaeta aestuarii]